MKMAGSPVPEARKYVRQVLERLLIDLSWNSSRLEGNTYSLLETERLFERGESAGGRNPGETHMILNSKRRRGFVWHSQSSGKTFTRIKAAERLFARRRRMAKLERSNSKSGSAS